ncbi:hypothetical protein FB107DRAFT_280768 [Schizophyllum commune]
MSMRSSCLHDMRDDVGCVRGAEERIGVIVAIATVTWHWSAVAARGRPRRFAGGYIVEQWAQRDPTGATAYRQ